MIRPPPPPPPPPPLKPAASSTAAEVVARVFCPGWTAKVSEVLEEFGLVFGQVGIECRKLSAGCGANETGPLGGVQKLECGEQKLVLQCPNLRLNRSTVPAIRFEQALENPDVRVPHRTDLSFLIERQRRHSGCVQGVPPAFDAFLQKDPARFVLSKRIALLGKCSNGDRQQAQNERRHPEFSHSISLTHSTSSVQACELGLGSITYI